jgi:hypothetical protein
VEWRAPDHGGHGRISVIYVPKEPLTDAERSELADHLSTMRIPAAAR